MGDWYHGSDFSDDDSAFPSASTDVARSSVQTVSELPCYSFAVKVRPDMDLQELSNNL